MRHLSGPSLALPVAPSLALILALAVGATLAGCKNETTVNPAPLGVGGGAGVGGAATTGASGGFGGGTVFRTVSRQNPWGTAVDNFMLDGSFELSTTIEGLSGQEPWLAFDFGGQRSLQTETGGTCNDGVRCALLTPNYTLYGRGVAPRDGAMDASLWARVFGGANCGSLQPRLVTCDLISVVATLAAESPEPTDGGVCTYTASAGPSPRGVCMLIENTLPIQAWAIADSAKVALAGGPPLPAPKMQLPAGLLDRMAALRDRIRARTPFGRAPRKLTVPVY